MKKNNNYYTFIFFCNFNNKKNKVIMQVPKEALNSYRSDICPIHDFEWYDPNTNHKFEQKEPNGTWLHCVETKEKMIVSLWTSDNNPRFRDIQMELHSMLCRIDEKNKEKQFTDINLYTAVDTNLLCPEKCISDMGVSEGDCIIFTFSDDRPKKHDWDGLLVQDIDDDYFGVQPQEAVDDEDTGDEDVDFVPPKEKTDAQKQFERARIARLRVPTYMFDPKDIMRNRGDLVPFSIKDKTNCIDMVLEYDEVEEVDGSTTHRKHEYKTIRYDCTMDPTHMVCFISFDGWSHYAPFPTIVMASEFLMSACAPHFAELMKQEDNALVHTFDFRKRENEKDTPDRECSHFLHTGYLNLRAFDCCFYNVKYWETPKSDKWKPYPECMDDKKIQHQAFLAALPVFHFYGM